MIDNLRPHLEIANKIIDPLKEIGFSDIEVRINHKNKLLINCIKYSDRANDFVGVAEMVTLPTHGTLSERQLIHLVVDEWLNTEIPLAKRHLLKKIKQW